MNLFSPTIHPCWLSGGELCAAHDSGGGRERRFAGTAKRIAWHVLLGRSGGSASTAPPLQGSRLDVESEGSPGLWEMGGWIRRTPSLVFKR